MCRDPFAEPGRRVASPRKQGADVLLYPHVAFGARPAKFGILGWLERGLDGKVLPIPCKSRNTVEAESGRDLGTGPDVLRKVLDSS